MSKKIKTEKQKEPICPYCGDWAELEFCDFVGESDTDVVCDSCQKVFRFIEYKTYSTYKIEESDEK